METIQFLLENLQLDVVSVKLSLTQVETNTTDTLFKIRREIAQCITHNRHPCEIPHNIRPFRIPDLHTTYEAVISVKNCWGPYWQVALPRILSDPEMWLSLTHYDTSKISHLLGVDYLATEALLEMGEFQKMLWNLYDTAGVSMSNLNATLEQLETLVENSPAIAEHIIRTPRGEIVVQVKKMTSELAGAGPQYIGDSLEFINYRARESFYAPVSELARYMDWRGVPVRGTMQHLIDLGSHAWGLNALIALPLDIPAQAPHVCLAPKLTGIIDLEALAKADAEFIKAIAEFLKANPFYHEKFSIEGFTTFGHPIPRGHVSVCFDDGAKALCQRSMPIGPRPGAVS